MRLLAALSLLGLSAIPATAQVPTAADSARRVLAIARSDLRNLVTAQELYFSNNARYAPTMEALLSLYRPSRGNVIKIVHAVNDGWTASLSGESLTGSCTIWVNLPEDKRASTALEKRVGGEGEPVCDTQPALASPTAGRD